MLVSVPVVFTFLSYLFPTNIEKRPLPQDRHQFFSRPPYRWSSTDSPPKKKVITAWFQVPPAAPTSSHDCILGAQQLTCIYGYCSILWSHAHDLQCFCQNPVFCKFPFQYVHTDWLKSWLLFPSKVFPLQTPLIKTSKLLKNVTYLEKPSVSSFFVSWLPDWDLFLIYCQPLKAALQNYKQNHKEPKAISYISKCNHDISIWNIC